MLPANKFHCVCADKKIAVITNITAENHSDTFRHLHQRKDKHGIFQLRSLTKPHGRRVQTSCLWCDADCMRLCKRMSKSPHTMRHQCARMRKKEQTNCYHRDGGTHQRCQFTHNRSAETLNHGEVAVLPAWSRNIHHNLHFSTRHDILHPLRGSHGVLRSST